MKKLLFGLIAILMFTTNTYSNQSNNLKENLMSSEKTVDDSEIVGNLIQECIILWSKKSFNSFYSDELSTLAEKEKLTTEENERLKVIIKNGHLEMMKDINFADAYNKYEALKLSSERFQELVNNYFINHPMSSHTYNKALIPNRKACINSAVILSNCTVISLWGCLGYIGVAVHC